MDAETIEIRKGIIKGWQNGIGVVEKLLGIVAKIKDKFSGREQAEIVETVKMIEDSQLISEDKKREILENAEKVLNLDELKKSIIRKLSGAVSLKGRLVTELGIIEYKRSAKMDQWMDELKSYLGETDWEHWSEKAEADIGTLSADLQEFIAMEKKIESILARLYKIEKIVQSIMSQIKAYESHYDSSEDIKRELIQAPIRLRRFTNFIIDAIHEIIEKDGREIELERDLVEAIKKSYKAKSKDKWRKLVGKNNLEVKGLIGSELDEVKKLGDKAMEQNTYINGELIPKLNSIS